MTPPVAEIVGRERITFDPVPHVYRVDGLKRPSVTTILKHAGMCYREEVGMEPVHSEIGDGVHHEIARILRPQIGHPIGHPDRTSIEVPEPLFSRVHDALSWIFDRGLVPILVEEPLWSDVEGGGFTGTADLGFYDPRGDSVGVADWKGSSDCPYAGPQTAAYRQLMYERTGLGAAERWVVYLGGETTPRPRLQTNVRDWHDFKAALRIHYWRRGRGLLDE